MFDKRKIVEKFALSEHIVVYPGDCPDLLETIPDESLTLVVTSPPYNIEKEYEKRLKLESYLEQQAAVIRVCKRCLSRDGGIRWLIGNHLRTRTSTVAAVGHDRGVANAMTN
jgi:adenine-specific DNA-methyltransferase